ncbi:MAG: glycoside hydrolase/phage tail family protein [Pseudomonadota bacterium]
MTHAVSSAALVAGRAATSALPRLATQIAATQGVAALNALLFGPAKRVSEGKALDEIRLLTAGEGGGVPRVYGRGRVGGQVIWASPVKEDTLVVSSTRGAKGFVAATETSATEYTYTVSLAIALCEGEIAGIGRVWADGKLITLADHNVRLYRGTDDQEPDTLIEAHEGGAPAYKGLAYIVFEDLQLGPFGNRVPQFNFEVERPLNRDDPDALENAIRALTIIPGSGEAVYATEVNYDAVEEGITRALNQHSGVGLPDFIASMDRMQSTLPNAAATSLVVSWFGDDLRAGHCTVTPGVELRDRVTEPDAWGVAGYDRQSARLLTDTNGRPSYGGTPSDQGVRQAIRELKARGAMVMLHPFLLMDVPAGNGLPDPYGGAEQGAFPWRGRITANALADDKTSAIRTQINAFFDQWDAMVLHYATLAASEGGVDAVLLGSELRGLTQLRDDTGAYPAVERLVALAALVKAQLPGALVSYGADWSEYANHKPNDGSGDLLYPLDTLWADGNVDFVGIDNYLPIADWREGNTHLDAGTAEGPYDLSYLESGISSGEGYDWYYASEADRAAQVRTPITDGAYNEAWVFRPKDLWSWWMNPHTERPGGIKATSNTPWVPQSKPIWFTELGCPAIDKGANQPNVFVDPKSSESAPPYFSTGARDDRIQRAMLEAYHRFWSDSAKNPVSSVYSGPMVDPARMFVYAWDARPFPDFPARGDLWADNQNWVTGHWLNGRAGRIPLSGLITQLASEAGLSAIDASACDDLVSGLTLLDPTTGREALEPLFDLYQLDATARDGLLIIRPRDGIPQHALTEDDVIDPGEGPLVAVEHAQDEELPSALAVTYQDELSDFAVKTTEVRDERHGPGRTQRVGTAVVLEQGEAEGRARSLLAEARALRATAHFALPEVADGIEPADTLRVTTGDGELIVRIVQMREGPVREITAVQTDPGLFGSSYAGLSADPGHLPVVYGTVAFAALDIPLLGEDPDTALLWLAAFADPWPGGALVYAGEGENQVLQTTLTRQVAMGRLVANLAPGPCSRWDRAGRVHITLPAGSLASIPAEAVLSGEHLCAVETSAGWELLQYRDAVLQGDGTWVLTELLRGRRATENKAALGASAGARIVFLEDLSALPLAPERWGQTEVFEVGPSSALPGAYPFRTSSVALTGEAVRPFAPVHLEVSAVSGGRHLSWIRRSRVGGDRWAEGDIPLGETTERYRVTIENSTGGILEDVETSAPEHVFDQPSGAVARVAQISSSYGPGRSATIAL